VLAPLIGLALFVRAVGDSRESRGRPPGPRRRGNSASRSSAIPFYKESPNDQGIGWNVLTSLGRVGIGFRTGRRLVGIPLGFMLGLPFPLGHGRARDQHSQAGFAARLLPIA